MSSPVQYVSISNVIIDDIVLWNGRTMMGTLGGSGTHAVMGMRVWHQGPLGLVAYLGDDFTPSMRQDLDRLGVDPRGLVSRPGIPTPRAWQLFEENGHRSEVFRTSAAEFHDQQVQLTEIPPDWHLAAGFHVQCGATIHQTIQTITTLRARHPGTRIVFEPMDEFLRLPQAEWQPLLQLCDVFLPNWEEAHCLTGHTEPAAMAQTLQAWGASAIVVRMGEKGVWTLGADGQAWRIPAVPVPVVDVTGAGNSFCGGILTGLGEDLDLLEASLRGVVSASFTIEQFGLPASFNHISSQAVQRYRRAATQVQVM